MYKFQGLLSKDKEGNISGPMSPVLFAQNMAKELNFKINGLVRVDNPQSESGYDHLIVKQKYKNGEATLFMFVDMGVYGLPIGFYHTRTDELQVTNLYWKNTTPQALRKHRQDCEISWKDDNPIIKLSESELKKLFKEASKTEQFNIN